MVSFREKDGIAHTRFKDLPTFLRAGDLLVVNDSATLPAALTARRASGEEIALHFSTQLHESHWVVEPRRVQATKGERLSLPHPTHAQQTPLAPHPRLPRLPTPGPPLHPESGRPPQPQGVRLATITL